MRVIELDVVEQLLAAGVVVITVGGGGIPVISDEDGNLVGVPAVIDKDLASALLAELIDADKVINVPVLKHHGLAKITMSIKNWMGIMGSDRSGMVFGIKRTFKGHTSIKPMC